MPRTASPGICTLRLRMLITVLVSWSSLPRSWRKLVSTARPTISSAMRTISVSVFFMLATSSPSPQDGDIVGHLHNLVEPVGDEEDSHALSRQLAHGVEQPVRLGFCQNGCGSSNTRRRMPSLVNLAGDLDKLHVTYGQAADNSVLVQVHAQLVQSGPGVLLNFDVVHTHQPFAEEAAEETLFGGFPVELDVSATVKPGMSMNS